ncbi:hypothetical protein Pst134EA_013886 [Puccinia striiformis f. sp. tritici]|uniref:hypothetical protein n=1 Tax=Puccinia striiformis f. sp. tritici TaxID=168172 RepID=UPI0020085B43|nr:hypothetical protein Pst134EA_013886 [Puccinia striiformis f. sp. tritici]KAH9466037.1 hypothetical protein Pst134EA_013886 [Puccinia striiformis f. sp. tritici]
MSTYRELVTRVQEIFLVARGMEEMKQKYDLWSDDVASRVKDPYHTIEDTATKSKILKKLQANLLPAIKQQITSLLKSLDDLDEEYPSPDVDLTLAILSDLDQTLQATVSSILTLADESHLPDEKHDHRLKNLKSFRCSQLRLKVECIVKFAASDLVGCYVAFMQSCALALAAPYPAWAWKQASKSKQTICMMTPDGLDLIDRTIAWSRKSDWAIVRRRWLSAVDTLDELLENLTKRANPSLHQTPNPARLTVGSTEESDNVDHTILPPWRKAAIERTAELASSIIALVKLARVLVKKLLRMIPRKRKFEPNIGMNSETLELFHDAFEESFTDPISMIAFHLRFIQCTDQATLTVACRDDILCSLNELKNTLETTSTIIAARLMPLLHGSGYASPASEFKAWSLTLEEPWDKVVDRSLDFVSSFEVDLEP